MVRVIVSKRDLIRTVVAIFATQIRPEFDVFKLFVSNPVVIGLFLDIGLQTTNPNDY